MRPSEFWLLTAKPESARPSPEFLCQKKSTKGSRTCELSSNLQGLVQPLPRPGSRKFPVKMRRTNPTTSLKGAEKRRSIRYKCEGRAQVREEGVDIHTWVTFTDVSMHGCYVQAQANYPPELCFT